MRDDGVIARVIIRITGNGVVGGQDKGRDGTGGEGSGAVGRSRHAQRSGRVRQAQVTFRAAL